MSSAARDWQPWHPLQIPLQRHRSNEAVSQMLGHDHAVGLASGPKRASMPCTSPPIPPRVVGLTPPKGSVTATLMMSAGLVARAAQPQVQTCRSGVHLREAGRADRGT